MGVVPAHDERCDVCAGDADREPPRPGERWSERAVFYTEFDGRRPKRLVIKVLGE